jgi:hypothetical protein
MRFDDSKEIFQLWGEYNEIILFRKLEYETAFDGTIKVYSVQTNNERINKVISGLYFHDFIFQTKNGFLLRQFKSKRSWPKTKLVHLKLDTADIQLIKKTNSTYDIWTVKELKKDNYLISISPDEYIKFESK